MDFRIARQARDRYGFEEHLFSTDGEAIVIEAARAMALAERFVSERDARARAASEIAAIGLIHELGHRAVAVERRNDPRAGGPAGARVCRLSIPGSAASASTAAWPPSSRPSPRSRCTATS